MQKAAIEAAKHEASSEMLDLVVDLVLEFKDGCPPPDVDLGKARNLEGILLVLREWQKIHEHGKRKALDAFVALVQEKLRADVGRL